MARNDGTKMHLNIERHFMGETVDSFDTKHLFDKFLESNSLTPYRTEWAVYDEDSKVAGTIDFLHCAGGEFIIYDWKRSNKVVSPVGTPVKEDRYHKHGYAPIAHLQNTSFWHYAMQLSIYRYILEKNYGITVADCRLVVLHPDYSRPYLVQVPYLKTEAQKLLSK